MKLAEGSPLTDNWQNAPIALDGCFYIFELKNAQQFLKGAKPKLQEHGPYCYL